MKRVTASEARRNWFRLLDEVVAGETIVVERKGQPVEIRRRKPAERRPPTPDYSTLLRVERPHDADDADRWSWVWDPAGGARPVDIDARQASEADDNR